MKNQKTNSLEQLEATALHDDQKAILKEIASLSKLLDSAVQIPLIRKSFGLDPVLGLLYGGGSFVSLLPALYIVLRAGMLGVPTETLIRMALNIALDFGLGLVPVIGQLSDFWFKANARNVTLIQEHFAILPPHTRA